MRSRYVTRIAVGSLALALVLAGCSKADETATPASDAPSPTTSRASQVKPVAVALRDAGGTETKSIDLSAGDTLVVILASNASTGYVWSVSEKPDPSVLTSAGKQVEPPTTPAPGAAGHQVFSFSATAPGTAGFTLSYARPFGSEQPYQVEVFNVTVT